MEEMMEIESEDCSGQSRENYSRPTIYKVPLPLHQWGKAAYEPQFISIGPYHRHRGSNNRLTAMERHKWKYLQDFLSRNPRRSFDDYFKEVEKLEEQARGCYSEEIDLLDRLEFTEVMVLDGCFVIELFLKKWERRPAKDDPVYSHSWVKYGVAHDLLLLENQLPFFILDYLYGTLNFSTPSMVQIALNYFSRLKAWKWGTGTVVPHHLLHLVHFHLFYPLIPSIPLHPPTSSTSGTTRLIKNIWECCLKLVQYYLMQKLRNLLLFSCFCSLFGARKAKLDPTHSRPWPKYSIRTIPSATRLKNAGITFSEQKVPKSPLDITFNISSGKMKIPYLCVDDNTNSIFRNFVALEQCLPSAGIEFTSYVSFMDDIVNTAQDVHILKSHGIIENLLGSDEEVALLFNRMGKGIFIRRGRASDQIWQVKEDAKVYSETKRHVRRATLMRDYIGTPWSVISVMAAAFLILLTLIQTIFAILSFKKSSK